MSDEEKHARRLIQIMKDAGTGASQIMPQGAIETIWLGPDDSSRSELTAGVQYAGDHGWIENAGPGFIRLTAEGAAIA